MIKVLPSTHAFLPITKKTGWANLSNCIDNFTRYDAWIAWRQHVYQIRMVTGLAFDLSTHHSRVASSIQQCILTLYQLIISNPYPSPNKHATQTQAQLYGPVEISFPST
jgi:hypothetical protein